MTTEQNKLIAEFMGQHCDVHDKCYVFGRGNDMYPSHFYPHQMHYHESWDWLMPVVKKINDAPGLSIGATAKKTELVMEVWNAVHVVDIEAAHKAVVRFIEWYNQQEKNLKPFNRDWEINPDSELFKLEKDNVGTGGNWHT